MWRRYGSGSLARRASCSLVFAVAALIVLPFAGRAIVRRGPLPVLLVALVTAALGALSLGLAAIRGDGAAVRQPHWGPGQAVMQPALATMIVDCSTTRDLVTCLRHAVLPAEPGARRRGLIGGTSSTPRARRPSPLLFAIEAAMFLVLVVVMATVRRAARAARRGGAGA